MTTSTILSARLRGVVAEPVTITATSGDGPLVIHGLAEAYRREAEVRVRAALAALDPALGGAPATGSVSVEPASAGCAGLDLAIALAVLDARGDLRALAPRSLDVLVVVGELGLAGDVRPVRGALATTELALSFGRRVLCARADVTQAALVDREGAWGVASLGDAVRWLRGDSTAAACAPPSVMPPPASMPDLADVRGQPLARRALEVAAAGGHSLLLIGPAGAGKTMLARRLSGILPPLDRGEALDVVRCHSAGGLDHGGALSTSRPFRAPHHSTTAAGITGGGAGTVRPGEVTLAHRGVLYLDDLPEFGRQTIECMWTAHDAREVVLARANGTVRMPADAMLVASAATPNPGIDHGWYLARATPERFALVVDMDPPKYGDGPPGEASAYVCERVTAARERQTHRGALNAHLADDVVEALTLSEDARALLLTAADRLRPNYRLGRLAVLRVARTCADLDGSAVIEAPHVAEALQFSGALR